MPTPDRSRFTMPGARCCRPRRTCSSTSSSRRSAVNVLPNDLQAVLASTHNEGGTIMTCNTMRWRSGCPCCDDRVAQDRRHFLFGGAMLGVASATGLLASATGAAAQSAPNPGAAAAPRGGNFILRGGYVITMDRALGDIPIG